MQKFILGTKQEMTQIFNEEGRAFPTTVIKMCPLIVTQVKTEEKDGYKSIQVGAGEKKEKNINKAQKSLGGNFKYIKEFNIEDSGKYKVGDKIGTDIFEVGDLVVVTGTSKGKGFQGVVKRHGFAGGRRTHGQKHSEREPGSIGAGGVQRVIKGMRMAGRMGGETITVKNLKVLNIDKENGLLYIGGAIPGRRGTLIEIKG